MNIDEDFEYDKEILRERYMPPVQEPVDPNILAKAQELIDNHALLPYVLDTIQIKYVGDRELASLNFLSVISLAIKNVIQPLHLHSHGEFESGKTTLFRLVRDLLPSENKTLSDDLSPKAILYANLKGNMLLSINDKVIDDDFGDMLNKACDKSAWENGFVRSVVFEGENRVQTIPPRTLWHISSNKDIVEYEFENTDGEAVASKFFSYAKNYEEKEKVVIIDKMYESEDNPAVKPPEEEFTYRTKVIQEALSTLIKQMKPIRFPFRHKDLERCNLGTLFIRNAGRTAAFCQCVALLNGHDTVIEEDMKQVSELLKIVESESALYEKDTAAIMNYLPPKAYYQQMSLEEKIKRITRDVISEATGVNSQTVYNRLNSLRKKELVGSEDISQNKKKLYVYYKTKDTKNPKWMFEPPQINKKADPPGLINPNTLFE